MFENIFKYIRQNFPSGNFYIVGGATRDFLLHEDEQIVDIDIATTLTPEEIRRFLPAADYRFANRGNVDCDLPPYHLTFAALRREGPYSDFRHPQYVEYVTSYIEDSYRRDFTINAIYFDSQGAILDPQDGLEDIKLRNLRMIGDPQKRLAEDPLRIVRALRFSKDRRLQIDSALYKAILESRPLLDRVSSAKISQELSKCQPTTEAEIKKFLNL